MKISTKALIFDWGDTIMVDYPEKEGPMHLWDKVALVEGARDLLESISQRYIICIATNAGESDSEDVKKALKRLDALQYFDHIYTSRNLGVKKPAPEFYIKICQDLNLMGYDCTMIGDNYEKDVVGAHKVSMRTVYFNKDKNQGEFPEADFVIEKLKELLELLDV